ncbi:glycerophosphodiester phosphodiesterase [Propionibacterium sp. oral taxon 192]|uniref:glycerophosphodiester phosphodiesterase n=1 Tax=Propionibacterium sp. oral taxon 192 TaxID=671222 RepID=UPI00039F913E|nr:glycerophosphodiester phosphodiesterase [Propionibacterium sp. oral taxon 192]
MSAHPESHPYFDVPFAPMAHRGGWISGQDESRENTLHAFTRAVKLGYRYLETDVHATRDGELIAFHDSVLDRVTDSTGIIASMPWCEIARAKIAGIDEIPTLDEVLETFPSIRFNIDIKAPRAVTLLARALRRHAAEDRVCVSSFSARRLDHFRRLSAGRVATGTALPGVAWASKIPWLPARLPMRGQAIQLPVSQRIKGIPVQVLTPRLLDTAHRHGMKVHVWTINDAETMTELIEMGVDGVISDRIDVLKSVALAHGVWH